MQNNRIQWNLNDLETTSRAHGGENWDLFKDAHNLREVKCSLPETLQETEQKGLFPIQNSDKEGAGKSKYSWSAVSLEIQLEAPKLSRQSLCYCWTFSLLQLHSHLSSQKIYCIFPLKNWSFILPPCWGQRVHIVLRKWSLIQTSCSSILFNILWSSN